MTTDLTAPCHSHPDDSEVIAAYRSDVYASADASEALDAYCGYWESFREYADEVAEELVLSGAKKDSTLAQYFDFDSFAHDLAHDYYTVERIDADGRVTGVFVFSAC